MSSMKKSERLKAAICSIVNDMDMEQENKFEVLDYLYNLYRTEVMMEEKQACATE